MWQAGYWPSYWQARYWPKHGAIVAPPPPPPVPPPPPFAVPPIFTPPPLTYDWVRSISNSSFITKVSYNASSQTMNLSYSVGGSDTFIGVGGDVAESLTSSFSPDSFFGKYVVGKFSKQ